MKIRPAISNDVAQLLSLAKSTDRAALWSEDTYHHIFRESGRVALVAEDDGRIVGFIVVHAILSEWEIENVAVCAEVQKQGIGKRLVEEVLTYARRDGASKLLLEVRESNAAARALYRKCGFEETGKRRHYYTYPDEDAVLLALELH
jgi:ribosomal-protein-alanine acetyltransferase